MKFQHTSKKIQDSRVFTGKEIFALLIGEMMLGAASSEMNNEFEEINCNF